ncbi:DUF262 domain-containing protein [Sorangium sp. So ce726]|uniref:DUF262 domain-containing protein n=1 Tax=Sorangium sp. So ce726 TaxID=3133319 RepID=UPI003F5F07C7
MNADTDPTREGDSRLDGYEAPAHGLETYPLDSVLIRTEQRAIVDVLRRIEEQSILLNPEFQRDFVWEPVRQSRLIESVLMRIPLPVFYVAEDAQGRLVVVDGLQRLTTFQLFAKRQLSLVLPNPELSGKDIDGIHPRLRRRFEDGQLTFYSIDFKAPDRVRFDIFDRVNSGVPLTRQQMRNALYSGPATRLLRELAGTNEFNEATGQAFDKQPRYRPEQLDREAVNRFLAFRTLGWDAYGGDMDEFLGRALQAVNKRSDGERDAIREAFLRSMVMNRRIFGRHAFCKHESPTDRKSPFNVLLFEVFSVLLSMYEEGRVGGREDEVRSAFYGLMAEPKFMRSISGGTTGTESVKTRFVLAEAAIRGALGDS